MEPARVHSLQMQRDGRVVAGFIALAEARHRDRPAAGPDSLLHPREQRLLAGLTSDDRRTSFLLGRHAAKAALAALGSDRDRRAIEIFWGVFGQPLVRSDAAPSPELSIAHAPDAAAAVACEAGHPVGVDLESIDPPREIREEDICAGAERTLLRRSGPPAPLDLLLAWTLKEALAKALRCGLMTPPAVYRLESLERTDDGAYQALFTNFPQYRGVAWMLSRHLLAIALPRRTELRFNPGTDLFSTANSH